MVHFLPCVLIAAAPLLLCARALILKVKYMNKKAEFKKLFLQTAPYHHNYKVFDDFISCFAISLHNAMNKDQELEDRYLSIIANYEKDDVFNFSKLGALLVGAYQEEGFCDLLGEVYMELEISSKELGQFFTPYCVSKLMAELTLDKNALQNKDYITLSEPACGSGGMLIAYAEVMQNAGLNPQKQLLVTCVDIDQTAAMMCYIQLTLLGIPAEVIIGNTLTMQFSRTMKTFMYHMDGWDIKRLLPTKQLSPLIPLINESKESIKHSSNLSKNEVEEELLQRIKNGDSIIKTEINPFITRLSINDDIYDLLIA